MFGVERGSASFQHDHQQAVLLQHKLDAHAGLAFLTITYIGFVTQSQKLLLHEMFVCWGAQIIPRLVNQKQRMPCLENRIVQMLSWGMLKIYRALEAEYQGVRSNLGGGGIIDTKCRGQHLDTFKHCLKCS